MSRETWSPWAFTRYTVPLNVTKRAGRLGAGRGTSSWVSGGHGIGWWLTCVGLVVVLPPFSWYSPVILGWMDVS